MSHDLVVLGDLVADLIIPVEQLPILPNRHSWAEGIFVEPGGAGNVLVAARRLNLGVASLGAVGADRYGAEMMTMLSDLGVDTAPVLICDERQTVLVLVLADVAGQHVYLGIKDHRGHWPFDERWHAIIRQSRALFTDGYTTRDVIEPDALLGALTTARQAGTRVFFDPGPSIEFVAPELTAEVLKLVDVLLLTDDEVGLLCDERERDMAARALLDRGPDTVVLKHGAAGCSVATRAGMRAYPGFPVRAVDTVGAGDSFAAAFIAGTLRGTALDDAATLANAMGAVVTTRRGAGTRIPPREELLAMLDAHPRVRALV